MGVAINITVDKINAERKLKYLNELLSSMNSICVAFSGGVDSTFLLVAAKEVLGENVIAVTATSPAYPEHELKEALALASSMKVRHIVIHSNELEIPGFSENSSERCYYCKSDLFEKMKHIAKEHGCSSIVDGSNYDDIKDHRPGRKAAEERGVKSPLMEAELSKKEIRYLSKQLGLNTWDKPSLACLSSRIPYGEMITQEKLKKIEDAEKLLKDWGFTQFRVRHHEGIARLEFIQEEITLFNNIEMRSKICTALKELGFRYITVDLEGYRSGSMNEVLES